MHRTVLRSTVEPLPPSGKMCVSHVSRSVSNLLGFETLHEGFIKSNRIYPDCPAQDRITEAARRQSV